MLNCKLALAPLAGYTDLPFRKVAKEYGADWTISEMINANALSHKDPKTLKMLTKNSNEDEYSVQIAANTPQVAKRAVEILNEYDFIDGIDLNVGCPVKKALKSGYGGYLLSDLKLLASIIQTIATTHKKKIFSVKMRIGFDTPNGVEIARVVEDNGAMLVSVHARTVKQLYKGHANYDEIARIKQAIQIPVIANGDITTYQKAQEVLAYTQADGLMIGRGAIGKPWIFQEIKTQRDIDIPQKQQIILSHLAAMYEWYGEYGVILFRKHLHTYSKGYKNAHEFRVKVNHITDYHLLAEEIERFFG
ncbi:MAG: tRNA-dihydrouridine synthase [Epsilonproteobacteria bacterium]|nr:tRNA-dihydrouridine synthase [Campylobacterota bacterium]